MTAQTQPRKTDRELSIILAGLLSGRKQTDPSWVPHPDGITDDDVDRMVAMLKGKKAKRRRTP